jgi:hypothetical protein
MSGTRSGNRQRHSGRCSQELSVRASERLVGQDAEHVGNRTEQTAARHSCASLVRCLLNADTSICAEPPPA